MATPRQAPTPPRFDGKSTSAVRKILHDLSVKKERRQKAYAELLRRQRRAS